MASGFGKLFGQGGDAGAKAIKATIRQRYFPELWPLLDNWLSLVRERQILEIGTGTGLFTEAFAKAGWTVACADPSLPSLMRAQARLGRLGVEGRFEQCEPDFLPFESGAYSAIACINMLEFSRRPDRVVREIHRILAPGGRAVIASFNRYSPWGLAPMARHYRRDDPPRPVRCLSNREFKKLVGSAKWTVDSFKERAMYTPQGGLLAKVKMPTPGVHLAFVSKPSTGPTPNTVEFVEDSAIKRAAPDDDPPTDKKTDPKKDSPKK